MTLQLLAPLKQGLHTMRMENSSFDGRYVALCAGGETGQFLLRLYDILHDQWEVVTEGPECDQVLGWTASEEKGIQE